MNLFFWRIFLSFWLANVLIAGGLIWTTGWIADRDDLGPAERVQEFVDLSFKAATQAVQAGNVQAVARRQGRRGPVHMAVFDEAGLSVLRGRPRLTFAEAQEALDKGGKAQIGGRQMRAAKAVAPDGTSYVIAMSTRAPPNPLLALSSQGSRWRFLIALVTSGAISFALASYFAGPIRRLRHATQQLARGDLTAQVDVPERKWGDDLVQLGREFNDMARRLRASYESQTNLLLDVSHELRSPLARLQVAVELLQRRTGDESAAELERIELEAARLNGLIGEILDLTRHSSGVAGRNPAPVDLIALLEDICEDARFEAGQIRVVDFTTNLPAAWVDGHAAGLRSCFENVVRNALQHGQSNVSVAAEVNHDHIRVRVTDTGPGVPASDLAKLFDPFYRSAQPDQSDDLSQVQGFGLGLAIVKAVVDAHNGTIQARSPQDGGLEIQISLPAGSQPD